MTSRSDSRAGVPIGRTPAQCTSVESTGARTRERALPPGAQHSYQPWPIAWSLPIGRPVHRMELAQPSLRLSRGLRRPALPRSGGPGTRTSRDRPAQLRGHIHARASWARTRQAPIGPQSLLAVSRVVPQFTGHRLPIRGDRGYRLPPPLFGTAPVLAGMQAWLHRSTHRRWRGSCADRPSAYAGAWTTHRGANSIELTALPWFVVIGPPLAAEAGEARAAQSPHLQTPTRQL